MYGKGMERDASPNKQKPKQLSREDRLKAALKANMGRRKAQARARAVQADENSTGENEES
jgi:hypothetical protein